MLIEIAKCALFSLILLYLQTNSFFSHDIINNK